MAKRSQSMALPERLQVQTETEPSDHDGDSGNSAQMNMRSSSTILTTPRGMATTTAEEDAEYESVAKADCQSCQWLKARLQRRVLQVTALEQLCNHHRTAASHKSARKAAKVANSTKQIHKLNGELLHYQNCKEEAEGMAKEYQRQLAESHTKVLELQETNRSLSRKVASLESSVSRMSKHKSESDRKALQVHSAFEKSKDDYEEQLLQRDIEFRNLQAKLAEIEISSTKTMEQQEIQLADSQAKIEQLSKQLQDKDDQLKDAVELSRQLKLMGVASGGNASSQQLPEAMPAQKGLEDVPPLDPSLVDFSSLPVPPVDGGLPRVDPIQDQSLSQAEPSPKPFAHPLPPTPPPLEQLQESTPITAPPLPEYESAPSCSDQGDVHAPISPPSASSTIFSEANIPLERKLLSLCDVANQILQAQDAVLSCLPLPVLEESGTTLNKALAKIRETQVVILKREKEVMQEDKKCKVCVTDDIEVVLIPCGHHCLCLECSTQLEACPVCNAAIDSRVRTYS